MRILCGTDFSEHSVAATHVAAALAARLGDSLELVHVLDVPVPAGPVEGMMGWEQFAQAQREAVRKALGSAAAALASGGVRVDTRVMEGQAARALAEAATAEDVRLCVLASHGRGMAERLALGSVADRLSSLISKPLLVVGPDGGPLAAALGSARPLRVVAGVDFGRASEVTLAFLRALAPQVAMDLVVVHTYWPPGEAQRLGLHGPADMYEADPDIQAILRAEMERRVGALPGAHKVRVRIVPGLGRPAERILDVAHEVAADLVVTGTDARGPLARLVQGSNARALLHAHKGCVLCIPRKLETHVADVRVPDYRHFAAGTDFSPLGNRAVLTALSLARARGGVVTLVHVMHGREAPVWDQQRPPDRPAEPDHGRAESRLRALVPLEFASVPVRVVVVAAPSPAEAIAQAVERTGADMLVLGRHGKEVVAEMVTGSAALKVLSLTRRPVVLVHE
ncbi:MAG: universal stress protein [Deltaproteobacteria bacterium]|nr:universal stress protein [Deltaproteobacteria bacterium]